MVFFNNKKFACESCIKGHRSSACNHTDRPLFEIKKKGRPVSQCPKCRELRQSKKLHSKCTCDHKDDTPLMQPLSSSSSSKPRYIPIVPALPNGLKDAIAASQSSTALPPDSRQRVNSLLNPCNCTDVWKCRCKVPQSANSSMPNEQISVSPGGLATLARAAVMQNSSPDADSRPSSSAIDPRFHHSRPANPANIAFRKRQKQRTSILAHMPGPDLAPMRMSPSSSFPPSIPDFPSMPSMSEISSIAGSGCTCGVQCACPGCVEHTTTGTGKRCGDGCGACIDPSIEVALPYPTPSQAKESTSILDRFFARAAANSSMPNVQNSVPLGGLATLNSSPDSRPSSGVIDPRPHHSQSATPANIAFHKRQKQRTNILAHTPGPDLAPIRMSPSSSSPPSIPDFPSMPSMSEISSIAGSGCTCGVQCACPGCVEHTGIGKRCGDGCGACIDPSIEFVLPYSTPSQAKDSTSFLDRFFARAAALPPPPAHRKMSSLNLDPMNTHTFLQSSSSQPLNFGVVNLPKLECDGRCDRSAGECRCRESCAGSCTDVPATRGECCGGSV